MKRRSRIVWAMVLMASVAVLFIYGGNSSSAPDYTVFSTRDDGASLLYDTLAHMGFPVAVGYAPVDTRAGINDVQVVISPNNPSLTSDMAAEMLAWVRRGGRLVVLDADHLTAWDISLGTMEYPNQASAEEIGPVVHFTLGLGEIITGEAEAFLNRRLMRDNQAGKILSAALTAWEADTIWFAEYYHGYRAEDNFLTRLPLVVKLAGFQLVIITVAVVWWLGKRFGKPIKHYEEAEREENEQVKALARLYGAAGHHKTRKHERK